MKQRSYIEAGLDVRVGSVLDAGSWIPLAPVDDSGVVAGDGLIHNLPVVIAGTDPSRASGAIDGADADALLAAVARARARSVTLVILLDSAGARLTAGVAVLGAFRRLETALLDAACNGSRICAVVGRHCFGGASLLAFAASARVYPRGALLGVSGPRALAAQGIALDPDEVAALYGADGRARHDENALLVADDMVAVRAALAAWLADGSPGLTIEQRQRSLMRRLRLYRGDASALPADPLPPELDARLDHLFPQGWSAIYAAGVIWGDGWVDGRETLVGGFVQGRPVDAVACWRLSQALLDLARDRSCLPVVILLDSPGQSSAVESEQLLLSEFIAQVAAVVYRLRSQDRSVELWLTGEAGGAIYVALSAAVTTVTAWPGARIQILPARVVSGVVGGTPEPRPPVSVLLEAHVIDRWTRAPGLAEPPES